MTKEKKVYEIYRIPKSYNTATRIMEGIEGSEIKLLHFNNSNDVYKGVNGIILIDKKGRNYDKIEISGDVETNKSLIEKILGEEIEK